MGWDFFALLILDALTHLCMYHLEYLQKSHVHLVMGKRNSEGILKTDQPTNSLDSIWPQEVCHLTWLGQCVSLLSEISAAAHASVCVWVRQTAHSSVISEGQCAYPLTTTSTTTPVEFAPQGYNRLIFQIPFFQSCQHNHHSLVLMAAGQAENAFFF